MKIEDQRRFWHHSGLDIRLMQACHIDYAYPRHSHDHYVICVIEWGLQSFTVQGTKYVTPPSGLILINPSVVHTGEPATETGFQMRSLYPTVAHMETAVYELTGKHQRVPLFPQLRIDDTSTTQAILKLHHVLTSDANKLESETFFLATLTELIRRYAKIEGKNGRLPLGNEREPIRKVRHYLETHFTEQISLQDLANHVALSPYYLLRVFHAEVGMPPHAYLQDVRVRHAQRLIEQGLSLAEVSYAVGFSSQSHLTRRFKQTVGLTPGQYANQLTIQ